MKFHTFGVLKESYKGIDLDFESFAEVRAVAVAVKVLEEFARMVEKAGGEMLAGEEEGAKVFEEEGENIETAIRLYLHKRQDLVNSSFDFNDATTVQDGHADGGLLRAFLKVTPKVAGVDESKEFFFEVMFDLKDRESTLSVFGQPRNGTE